MRRHLFPLMGVLLVGSILRILYLIHHLESPFFDPAILDPGYYHAWALKLLEGKWIQSTAFFGLPLYPVCLAFIYKCFGGQVIAAKIFQQFLGLSHVVLVYILAETLFRRRTLSLIAAFLAAVYVPYLFHEVHLLPETLGIPLYTLSLLLSFRFWQNSSVRNALAFAVSLTLAGLTKPGIFLFLFFFLAYYAFLHRDGFARKAARAASVLATAVLLISPITLHNWVAARDWVPLTWHGGLNFYIGNNPHAQGLYTTPPGVRSNISGQIADSKMVAEQAQGHELKPSEVSHFWFQKGVEFLRQHPQQAAILMLRKAALFVNQEEITDLDSIAFSKQISPVLRWNPFDFLFLFVFAVPGLAFGLRHIDRDRRILILGWILAYTAGILAFFVNARYRLPLISVLFPFASFAMHWIFIYGRRFNLAACSLLVCLMGGSYFLSTRHFVEPRLAVQYSNAGNILMAKGEWKHAISYYERSMKDDPRYAKAYNDAGVAYREIGDTREAKRLFRLAIRRDRNNPHSYNNLGLLLDHEGKMREAQGLFQKAIEIQPNLPEAHNNLGMVFAKRRRWKAAEASFLRAIELKPRNPRAMTNLGLVHYLQGNRGQAKSYWEEALRIAPNYVDARNALKQIK